MPATIRIDFDVNAGSISEALKAELAKVQGVTAAANTAVENAKRASNTKIANDAIKEEKRVAAEALKQESQVAKEKEKQENYLLRVRMNSIKAANAAELKAQKEQEKAAKEAAEHAAHQKEKRHDMVKEVVGIGAAVEGFKLLTEHAEEATAANKRLATGTGLTGEALEKQKKIAVELGEGFAVGGDKAKDTMGKVAYYTHAQGKELNDLTKAALAYEAGTGKDAARKLATEKGRAELMINLAQNTAKAQKAANDPAVQAQYIQTKLMETIGELAVTVLTALGPALKVVMPIVSQLGELLGEVLKPVIAALSPIITTIGKTFADLTPIITELINTALEIITPILQSVGQIMADMIPPILGVVKAIMDALMPVFKALQPVINEVIDIFQQMFEADMQTYIGILQDVFVPIIRDVVAPLMLSLIPIIQQIADLFRDYAVPAIKILNGILQFLMHNVIQPLIKWLGNGLVNAIQSVVGVITKAIDAVKSITNAIGSFLGLGGDKAVAAVKKTNADIVTETKAGNEAIEKEEEYHYDKSEKKQKQHHEKKKKVRDDAAKEELKDAENLAKWLDEIHKKQFDDRIKAFQDEHDRRMKFVDADTSAELHALDLLQASGSIKEKDYQEKVYQLKLVGLKRQLALLNVYSDDYKNTLDAITQMERAHEIDLAKATTEAAKEQKKSFQDQINGIQDVAFSYIDLISKVTSLHKAENSRNKGLDDALDKQLTLLDKTTQKKLQLAKTDKEREKIAADSERQQSKLIDANEKKQKEAAEQTDKTSAVEKAANLAKAASNMVATVAGILEGTTAMGPFGILAAPGLIGAAIAMFASAKSAFGFEKGGFTGYGSNNQPAGVVHKNEFVLKSGSFAVDSSGNLVAVAGMNGGNAHLAEAIHHQTKVLGEQMSKSTVINQRHMVMENKVIERSRSRESV